jgi:hypothetical protein
MKHDFSSVSTLTNDTTRVDFGYLYRQLNNLEELELMDVVNHRLKKNIDYHAMSSALAHAYGRACTLMSKS